MKQKYREYFKLNRNIFIAFVVSIIISATVAQFFESQEAHLNTTITLLADYATFFSVLSVLLYIDNRKKYKLDSGETNWALLKVDLVKIIYSLGISEAVYTVVRWVMQYYFLQIDYDPYLASVVSQIIATTVYMVTLNVTVKLTKLFRD